MRPTPHHRRTGVRCAVAVLLATASLFVASGSPAAAATVSDPLIDGLSGPLGLAVGRDGTVYVTESFGVGRLTAIGRDGSTTVLATNPVGELAGVDALGRGTLVVTSSTFTGDEEPPADGSLGRLLPNGRMRQVASIEDYEHAANPDQVNTYGVVGASEACTEQVDASPLGPATYEGYPDSHPYAAAIVPGGTLVADAGANALFEVRADGGISTVAVFPPVPTPVTEEFAASILDEFGVDVSECIGDTYFAEPVPTDVEIGPDGDSYVTTLPGTEAPGQGAVWRVDRRTGALELVTDGLFTPVDLAIADDGTMYVAELFASQISVIAGGAVTGAIPLDSPGAVEVGPHGDLYATTGVFGDGAVVSITP